MLTFSSTKNDAIVYLIWIKFYLHAFANFLSYILGFFKVVIGRPTRKDIWLKTEQGVLYARFVPNVAAVPQSGTSFSSPRCSEGRRWWPRLGLFPFSLSCPSLKALDPNSTLPLELHCTFLFATGMSIWYKKFLGQEMPSRSNKPLSFTSRQLLFSSLASLLWFQ